MNQSAPSLNIWRADFCFSTTSFMILLKIWCITNFLVPIRHVSRHLIVAETHSGYFLRCFISHRISLTAANTLLLIDLTST